MRCTEPVEVFVEGCTPALAPGASVETTTLKEFFVFIKPVGLDTAVDASTAGFTTNAQPSAQRETAYSTNGLRLEQAVNV